MPARWDVAAASHRYRALLLEFWTIPSPDHLTSSLASTVELWPMSTPAENTWSAAMRPCGHSRTELVGNCLGAPL